MSEEPPPQVEVGYQTPAPQGNAALLVKLAAVLNLIVAGLDVGYGLLQLGLMGFIFYILSAGVLAGGSAIRDATWDFVGERRGIGRSAMESAWNSGRNTLCP